jgi:AcrR family transcriptional regulator
VSGATVRRKQERGLRTEARLIAATNQVVAEVGYAHATTRRIAEVAGVAEGTIYRHFTDKQQLFYAAVLAGHADAVAALENLPTRAGKATVEQNLRAVLTRLAQLRPDLLPLELWMLGKGASEDADRRTVQVRGPEEPLTRYLAAEQRMGRVDRTLDPEETALTIVATLFGIAVLPSSRERDRYERLVAAAVTLLLAAIVA